MLILSLDSAGHGCAACVWRDGKALAQAHEAMERGQDRRLMPLILDVMRQAGVDFPDIDRIASTRGPGSFTGLRIGLAAAAGLGLATAKPVIGVSRFALYRAMFANAKGLLVLIDSRRKELFGQFYPATGAAPDPFMMTADEILDFLKDKPGTTVTGDGDWAIPGFRPAPQPETIICAEIAARADSADETFLPRPLYLRPPDVTVKAAS